MICSIHFRLIDCNQWMDNEDDLKNWMTDYVNGQGPHYH